jgi:glucose-6-phosphate-specific signal transduction histidine kinase
LIKLPRPQKTFVLELFFSSLLYASFYFLNLWLTSSITPEYGAHWLFLPAGIALLLSLTLPFTGPLGILLAVFAIAYWIRFPEELIISIGIAIIAGLAPFISRIIVVNGLSINHDLSNLNIKNLTLCVLIYSIIRAVLHHNWYVFMGLRVSNSDGFTVEFAGNALGTLLILLIFKYCANIYMSSKSTNR